MYIGVNFSCVSCWFKPLSELKINNVFHTNGKYVLELGVPCTARDIFSGDLEDLKTVTVEGM